MPSCFFKPQGPHLWNVCVGLGDVTVVSLAFISEHTSLLRSHPWVGTVLGMGWECSRVFKRSPHQESLGSRVGQASHEGYLWNHMWICHKVCPLSVLAPSEPVPWRATDLGFHGDVQTLLFVMGQLRASTHCPMSCGQSHHRVYKGKELRKLPAGFWFLKLWAWQ